jgi:hypothetical protein
MAPAAEQHRQPVRRGGVVIDNYNTHVTLALWKSGAGSPQSVKRFFPVIDLSSAGKAPVPPCDNRAQVQVAPGRGGELPPGPAARGARIAWCRRGWRLIPKTGYFPTRLRRDGFQKRVGSRFVLKQNDSRPLSLPTPFPSPTFLARHGHEVINPKLPDDDFNGAVRIAQAEFDKHQPQVVVGVFGTFWKNHSASFPEVFVSQQLR